MSEAPFRPDAGPRAVKAGLAAALMAALMAPIGVRAATPEDLQLPPPSSPPPPAAGGREAVAPFVLQVAGAARERAIACLTAAVYYEAGTQSREGQEAVAQVVLNRVRHPAFPKSVCGVVYEGAERTTGCQFSFACDGSTARRPLARRWREAEAVAIAALQGHVAERAGAATHYHAVGISPYWRASLIETGRIGGHVFYRMGGAEGSAEALTGRYAGDEPLIEPAPAAGRIVSAATGRALPSTPSAAQFSVWGLDVATVTARHGDIVVKPAS